MKLAFSLLLGLALTPTSVRAQAVGRFAAYEHCRFSDPLTLVEEQPLAKGIEGRTVKTVMGARNIPLTGGTRLIYAYADTQPFANVKVEQVPTADYKQAKQDLIANFELILTGNDPVTRNYALKPRLNGAEIYGLDRTRLEGAVVGIYLFFVDRTHTAITIDFLNQPPDLRRFSSLEDYAPLRDSFLNTYTRCAAGGAPVPAPAKVEAAIQPPSSAGDSPRPTDVAPVANPLPDAPLPNGAAAAEVAPNPTFIEPVAKPVAPKQQAKSTKLTAKPGAKAPAKSNTKPAGKSNTKPASKPPTKSEKKPASAKASKASANAKDKKPAKPKPKPADPDQN